VTVEYAPVPRNYATQKLAASIVLGGPIVVYGFTVYNTKSSAQYLNMFDADALPAEATTPVLSWPLAANSGVGFGWQPNGRLFGSGLVLCNSSTDATKTIGSADCLFDVQYDRLDVYPQENAPGTGQ
jgi:hypothetical protein